MSTSMASVRAMAGRRSKSEDRELEETSSPIRLSNRTTSSSSSAPSLASSVISTSTLGDFSSTSAEEESPSTRAQRVAAIEQKKLEVEELKRKIAMRQEEAVRSSNEAETSVDKTDDALRIPNEPETPAITSTDECKKTRGKKEKVLNRRRARLLPFLPSAAMQAHVLFFIGATTLKVFIPRLVTLLATPAFISLLSFHFPLVCTVAIVYQYKEEQSKRTQHPPQSPTAWIRQPSRGFFLLPSMEETFADEMLDWLRFWMVRAAVEAVKVVLSSAPVEFKSPLLQLELLFYLWVYCLPFCATERLFGYVSPSKRPLRLICQRLGPYSHVLVETASSAVPMEWWQTNVVRTVTQMFNTLILVKLLDQPLADRLIHILQEARTFVVPAVVVILAPGFLNQYGVVYVKFGLSIAKSFGGVVNNTTSAVWLQYWVLHSTIDAVLYYFSSIWWLIPFSTHALFCLWYYLSLPQTIKKWYGELETELQQLGLLPADEETEENAGIDQTKTAKILALLWQLLPKAEDAGEFYGPQNKVETNEDTLSSESNPRATEANPSVLAKETSREAGADAVKKPLHVETSGPRSAVQEMVQQTGGKGLTSPTTPSRRKSGNEIIAVLHKDNFSPSYKERAGKTYKEQVVPFMKDAEEEKEAISPAKDNAQDNVTVTSSMSAEEEMLTPLNEEDHDNSDHQVFFADDGSVEVGLRQEDMDVDDDDVNGQEEENQETAEEEDGLTAMLNYVLSPKADPPGVAMSAASP